MFLLLRCKITVLPRSTKNYIGKEKHKLQGRDFCTNISFDRLKIGPNLICKGDFFEASQ